MMKWTGLLLIMLLSVAAIAQNDDEVDEDYTPGGSDRLVLTLNWNGWADNPDSIDVKWFSRGINLHAMYDLKFGKSNFSFAPGLGLAVDNVYHNGYFVDMDTLGTLILPYGDSLDYDKNKLTTTYFEVPLEFRFRSNPGADNYAFKVGLGVKGGLLISSHTKYKGPGFAFGANQEEIKEKQKSVPNLAKFRYGLTARIGYGPFNITGFYGLSTLFEEGLGPNMVPVSVGISFNGL